VNWSDLDPAWYWLIGAALLAATELAIPGVFLVWLAAAALLTALLTFATGVGLPAQLVMFGIASIAMVLIGRRAYGRMSHASSDPLLNDRGARLVGRTVVVVAAIEQGEGRVKVGDGIWNARGPDAPEGARVRITGTSGSCLLVSLEDALASNDATS
jgi:inner membrane protein